MFSIKVTVRDSSEQLLCACSLLVWSSECRLLPPAGVDRYFLSHRCRVSELVGCRLWCVQVQLFGNRQHRHLWFCAVSLVLLNPDRLQVIFCKLMLKGKKFNLN